MNKQPKYNFEEISSSNHLSPEQNSQISDVATYLEKHKIDSLFNELLASLVAKKPEDVKAELLSTLNRLKKSQRYFTKKDFEALFESYDFFEAKGGNQVHYKNLMQALSNMNIEISHQQFLAKYPQFKLGKYVKKEDFVSILEKEYSGFTAFQ